MRTESGGSSGTQGGGPALFRLVRFWSRRWAAGAAQESTEDSTPVGHVLVLEAIDGAAARGSAAIGNVALELGLDRSNASRMLAEAVLAGLVTKSVSSDDARRAELGITPEGRSQLAAARVWQEEVFAQLVADWPEEDARRFAGYLHRLASQPPPSLDPGAVR
jgi:DNA-binding MarR family transcriptional regulator